MKPEEKQVNLSLDRLVGSIFAGDDGGEIERRVRRDAAVAGLILVCSMASCVADAFREDRARRSARENVSVGGRVSESSGGEGPRCCRIGGGPRFRHSRRRCRFGRWCRVVLRFRRSASWRTTKEAVEYRVVWTQAYIDAGIRALRISCWLVPAFGEFAAQYRKPVRATGLAGPAYV